MEPPPAGTPVCAGFDGSENSDWTGIRLETIGRHLFTPRYGADRLPTIWDPSVWGGRIPRDQVSMAWAEITETYRLERAYCDPGFHDETSWETEIDDWALEYGEDVFVQWPTNQLGRMFPALTRFESDLKNGAFTHDGCPSTATHMGNARKIPKPGDRYTLAKPSPMQKIDLAVVSVLAHEAAADARTAGWTAEPQDRRVVFLR